METLIVIAIIIGVVIYLFSGKKESIQEFEVGTLQANYHDTSKYKLYVMPTVFTRLKILDLRNKKFDSLKEIDRLRIKPKEGHPQRIFSWQDEDDRVWTDAGYVYSKEDLEEYFRFLEQIRMIYEDDSLTADIKISDIMHLFKMHPEYKKYYTGLNEQYGSFPDCLFYRELTEVNGIGKGTAQDLYNAGIISLDDLREASEEQLKEVPGIGNKTILQIQNYFKNQWK